jgi:hypothetical protein
MDATIVSEKKIGDRGESASGVIIVDGDRLVGEVAARHHQWDPPEDLDEADMQRRRREHDAKIRIVGSDRWCDGRREATAHQDDGAARREKKLAFEGRDFGESLGQGEVGDHQSQRLGFSVFTTSKFADGVLQASITNQMVAADTLECSDLPCTDGIGEDEERVCGVVAGWTGGPNRQLGSASRTGDRLSMETPIGRIVKFAEAVRTQGEVRHRGVAAVERRAGDDGQTGSAVGAIQEGVEKASIRGVIHFAEAIGAGGQIRRDVDEALDIGKTGLDAEVGIASRRHGVPSDLLDASQGRRLGGQNSQESLDLGGAPLDLDEDSGRDVADETREANPLGQAIDVGAKPDALDESAHPDAAALDRIV